MEWKNVQISEDGTKIPDSWIFMHYYDALNALFRIENSLRVLVFLVLKRNFRGKWQDINLSSDDQSETTIAALAKKRTAQDQMFGYLGYPIVSPLMHLTSGELVRLITSDSYWKYFKGYFKASKEVVTLKLQEIGNVRNSLAHFRPINPGDVDVVKQNARQVLSRIEETFEQLANINSRVPTNTEEPWYKALNTVGNSVISLGFVQSNDEQWVKLALSYSYPLVATSRPTDSYRGFRVLNLKTPGIFTSFPALGGNVLFATEGLGSSYVFAEEPDKGVRKVVSLVFHRQVLAEHFEEIRESIEGLLSLVASETELIQEDNLARGKMVDVVDVSASRDKGVHYWKVNIDRLACPVTSEGASEYWGAFSFSRSNFITETESFPWMPVKISEAEDDIPF